MSTAERETWATRAGFILAAVGSAVGLGNVWRFPFQVGQEGGAAFLLVYLLLVVLVGLPAILVEFAIGRRSERNPIDAFGRIGYDSWTVVGGVAVAGGFLIMTFYSVVGGWIARYTLVSATGSYFDDPAGYFETVSAGGEAVLFHLLFVAVTAGVVAFGVRRGIELAVKLMVPALAALLVLLAGYAFTLEGATAGYEWYLSPDVGVLAEEWPSILPAALGQALFTLSLGMGIMITYASYIGEDRNLGLDAGWIVGLNTAVSIVAGLIVFPVIFSIEGVEPGEGGAGELFVGIGEAIGGVPGSEIVGVVFFGTVRLAALSSAISIFEVSTSFLVDHFAVDRRMAAGGLGVAVFVLGTPSALDTNVLTLVDNLTADVFLPATTFLLVLFAGWFYAEAVDELGKGVDSDLLPTAWLWHVRTLLLVVVGITLLLSLQEFAAEAPDQLDAIDLG